MINQHDPNSPKVGDSAMIQINNGAYAVNGHVAAVTAINPDGTITIQEAHYSGDTFDTRTGTPKELGIVGYYDGTQK